MPPHEDLDLQIGGQVGSRVGVGGQFGADDGQEDDETQRHSNGVRHLLPGISGYDEDQEIQHSEKEDRNYNIIDVKYWFTFQSYAVCDFAVL